jgi:hypothetical protein
MRAITLFVVSLLIWAFTYNSSADTPQIRLSVQVVGDEPDDVQLLSALSQEFRKLDGVSVTDNQPALRIRRVVIHSPHGYAASVAIMWPDGRPATHIYYTSPTVDVLAHTIATVLDGSFIQQMRRAVQPSSSP